MMSDLIYGIFHEWVKSTRNTYYIQFIGVKEIVRKFIQ